MSRVHINAITDEEGFPRMSGDEPATLTVAVYASWFSPHERG